MSQPMARDKLASLVAQATSERIAVHIYPLTVSLVPKSSGPGIFEYFLNGPPGIYPIELTSDFVTWTGIGPVVNTTGSVSMQTPAGPGHGFYRALVPD